MIHLITGTPGSGKTYLTISLMIEKYYKKNDFGYVLNDEFKDYTVIANIAGLKLPHISLDDIIEKVPFETFFTNDYQKKIREKYKKIIYVIDECQRYFPYTYKNQQVIFYFDYHRHYQDEILLVTQDSRKITPSISTLVEFEYRAIKPTFQLPGIFTYNLKSAQEIFGRKTVRKKKEIFDLYQSFNAPGGTKKTKKAKILYLLGILIIFFIGNILYTIFIDPPFQTYKRSQEEEQKNLVHASTNVSRGTNILPHGTQNVSRETMTDTIQIVELRDYVSIKEQLLSFRCPISLKIIKPVQASYRIFNHSGSFFASVPSSLLPVFPPSSDPGSGEPHKEASKRYPPSPT